MVIAAPLSWIGLALTQNPAANVRRGFVCLGLDARLDAVKTMPRLYAAGSETWAAWVGSQARECEHDMRHRHKAMANAAKTRPTLRGKAVQAAAVECEWQGRACPGRG